MHVSWQRISMGLKPQRKCLVHRRKMLAAAVVVAAIFVLFLHGPATRDSSPPGSHAAYRLVKSSNSEPKRATWPQLPTGSDGLVAMCARVKDEHHGILEWIVYHNAIGVSKFYLRDNGSVPPMRPLVQPFIDSGLVVYEYVENSSNIEKDDTYYTDTCLAKYRHSHKYMAFIDVDEFIVLKGPRNLEEFMKPYDHAGCVIITWRLFASSGHQVPPMTGVLQNYVKCLPLPTTPAQKVPFTGKAIAVLENVERIRTHQCIPLEGKLMVDTHNKSLVVHGNCVGNTIMSDYKAEVYHYRTKSWSEFNRKSTGGWHNRINDGVSLWDQLHFHCQGTCTDAVLNGAIVWRLLETYGLLGLWEKNLPQWLWEVPANATAPPGDQTAL